MQALLFEMKPRDGHEDHYFRHVAKLRPIMLQQDGLIFIERFKSASRPRVILSHSLWRDEASIARWRTNAEHQKSQTAGRYKHFEDYRIRIAHVLHFGEPDEPDQDWTAEGSYSDPATTPDRFVTVTRSWTRPASDAAEVYHSVTEEGSYLSVSDFSGEDDARAHLARASRDANLRSVLLGRTTRDYGLYDRAEAPQYFRPVESPE